MTSDKDAHLKCKNGHAIVNVEGKIIMLQQNVVRCNRCGNTTVVKEIPVWYEQDIFTDAGSRVHIYTYLKPFVCMGCGGIVIRQAVECLSPEFGVENYEHHKKIGTMPNGFVRN